MATPSHPPAPRADCTGCALGPLAQAQAAMLDNDLVGMARVRDRRIVWKNRALDRIFGYTDGELLGQPTRLLYLDDVSHAHVGRQYPLISGGGCFRGQLKMRHKDGHALWIDLSGSAVAADEALWMMVDITALKQSEERARHMALHDHLTQLPNRALFEEQLDLALADARRRGCKTALCSIDLDDFKPVNDTQGHDAGDAVLKAVAARLRHCMRENDLVARLGGDEFVMVFVGLTGEDELAGVLNRLLHALAQPFTVAGGAQVFVGASVGAAMAPDDATQAQALHALADQALYQAKRSGKNNAHLHGVGELCRLEPRPGFPRFAAAAARPSS